MIEKLATRFPSEEELVSAFVEFVLRTNDGSFQILREFEGGFGRPDVLLYSNPSDNAAHDIQSLSELNPRLAPLLSTKVSKTVRSLSALAAASGASRSSTRRIANELARIDRLKMTDATGNTFKISPIRRPPFSQVVAIEAKLRDWRRALVQAYRYLQFSTEAWVVLDYAAAASAIKEEGLFRSCGVGLASFSASGELHIHVFSKNEHWQDSALAWRTQAILARS